MTLPTQVLGGTEATIVRIASALSATEDVVVCQHNRTTSTSEGNSLSFVSMADAGDHVRDADHLVFVKMAPSIDELAKRTRARLWLWLHNDIVEEQAADGRVRGGAPAASPCHVRESMRVFDPQFKCPKTFGLVYAESNAAGAPVLAPDFGSAEVAPAPRLGIGQVTGGWRRFFEDPRRLLQGAADRSLIAVGRATVMPGVPARSGAAARHPSASRAAS